MTGRTEVNTGRDKPETLDETICRDMMPKVGAMTHDAETVERMAMVISAQCWEKTEGEWQPSISQAMDMARAALSAMPPQEVSVQQAAKVLLDANNASPANLKQAWIGMVDSEDADRCSHGDLFIAALRALSEAKP